MVRLDLGELLDQGRVADVEASQAREGLGRHLGLAPLDEEARRLGQDEHADDEDDGPGELDGDGDAVRARVVSVLGRVVDDGREHEADGDGELVAADDGAADPLGRRLGLVQRDQGRDDADAEAGEEAAGEEHGDGRGDGLEHDAEVEDGVGRDEPPSTAQQVTRGRGRQGPEESTGREDRDDGGGLAGRDVRQAVLLVDVAGREQPAPVQHREDATDRARVIPVEPASGQRSAFDPSSLPSGGLSSIIFTAAAAAAAAAGEPRPGVAWRRGGESTESEGRTRRAHHQRRRRDR